MLQSLQLRETGLCETREFVIAQKNHRSMDMEASTLRDFVNSHSGGVNAMDLENIDGRFLLVGGGKGAVVIYDVINKGGTPKYTHHPLCSVGNTHKHKFSVETVQWYPFDNGLFTTSGSDKLLKVWDSNALVPAETFEFSSTVYSHHMSPCATEHNLIAVGTGSSQAKLIDMRTGSNIQILKGHTKPVFCVKWSPCLPFILTTGSQDGHIFLWDVRMAKGQMSSLDQHNGKKSVGTAHTGHVLAMEYLETGYHMLSYGSDNIIRLWDAFSGQNLLINYGKVHNDLMRCLKMCTTTGSRDPVLFIPEGELIRVFSVMTGKFVKTLSGHFRQVNCCYYNSFSQEVYSGSNDRNLLIWSPHHEVEKRYNEYLESLQSSVREADERGRARGGSGQQAISLSAMADTWSDDGDSN